jgi:uncharacterized Fe-S cluster protein YjdI
MNFLINHLKVERVNKTSTLKVINSCVQKWISSVDQYINLLISKDKLWIKPDNFQSQENTNKSIHIMNSYILTYTLS